MKVNLNQLDDHLNRGIQPLYLVTGDEPLLVQEACDRIRDAAREAGFSERKVFHADPHPDWARIGEEASALSLFAERQRIEVRMNSGKLTEPGRKFLEQTLLQPSEDVVIILSGPRLEAAETRRAWFKKLDKGGVQVPIWPIEPRQFPQWLRQRAQRLGLHLTDGALEILSDRLEGNLLAASQELERLRLLSDTDTIAEDAVMESVLDSSRFNAFELARECLMGNVPHSLKILHRLALEGQHALPVLSVLQREIQQLEGLLRAMQSGTPAAQYFRDQRIRMRNQQQALERAAQRLSVPALSRARALCQSVDRSIKGFDDRRSPWVVLEQLVQYLAAPPGRQNAL